MTEIHRELFPFYCKSLTTLPKAGTGFGRSSPRSLTLPARNIHSDDLLTGCLKECMSTALSAQRIPPANSLPGNPSQHIRCWKRLGCLHCTSLTEGQRQATPFQIICAATSSVGVHEHSKFCKRRRAEGHESNMWVTL